MRAANKTGSTRANRNIRKCPAKGCSATINANKFVCLSHWRLLSPRQQQSIHWAYTRFQYKITLDALDKLKALQKEILEAIGLYDPERFN